MLALIGILFSQFLCLHDLFLNNKQLRSILSTPAWTPAPWHRGNNVDPYFSLVVALLVLIYLWNLFKKILSSTMLKPLVILYTSASFSSSSSVPRKSDPACNLSPWLKHHWENCGAYLCNLSSIITLFLSEMLMVRSVIRTGPVIRNTNNIPAVTSLTF